MNVVCKLGVMISPVSDEMPFRVTFHHNAIFYWSLNNICPSPKCPIDSNTCVGEMEMGYHS